MKKNKFIVIAATVALIAAFALIASACVTTEDTQINDALKLAAESDYLKIEVSDDSGVFYVFDNGEVTDVYGLGVKFENVVGQKGEAPALTIGNLKEGYTCEKDAETGDITLSAELVNTEEICDLDGATLTLTANTVNKEISSCVITYTDQNGYKVKITLA